MPASAAQLKKRALVACIAALAASVGFQSNLSRDATDAGVSAAVRRAAPKVAHDPAATERLRAANEAWQSARREPGRRGRRPSGGQQPADEAPPAAAPAEVADPDEIGLTTKASYVFHARAAMFTYMTIQDQGHWLRFLAFVKANLRRWGVRHWCATLERCKTGRLHAHLFLEFQVGRKRMASNFAFGSLKPRIDVNDYLGDAPSRGKLQESINRGFFYVWADKVGTERDDSGAPCVAGNYAPAWTDARETYQVRSMWAEKLWQCRKLDNDTYETYLFLSRDGVVPKKRNLDAVKAWEEEREVAKTMQDRIKRIRGNPSLFHEFPVVPQALRWLDVFKVEKDRYPILVVHGPSRSGKTEWAKSLFKNALELKVGALVQFPEGMRRFDRKEHDGIVLDDVRDCAFFVAHQEKLQGKYDYPVEFASTPGGQCAFFKDLWAIPIVATINNSTANLNLLTEDDWLGHEGNRELVHFPPR